MGTRGGFGGLGGFGRVGGHLDAVTRVVHGLRHEPFLVPGGDRDVHQGDDVIVRRSLALRGRADDRARGERGFGAAAGGAPGRGGPRLEGGLGGGAPSI